MKTLAKLFMTLSVIFLAINLSNAKVLFTELVGGANGSKFMLPSTRYDVLSTDRIANIAIRHGRRVEKIEIEYANRRGTNQTESIGNEAGKWSYINLDKDEFIVYITGRSGTLIDQVTFYTSKRRVFGPYGGKGGNTFEINIPSNAKVIGFFGKEGPSINQLGLIYKTAAPKKKKPKKSKKVVRDHRKKEPTIRDHRKEKPVVRDHRISGSGSISGNSKYRSKNKLAVRRPIIEMNGRGTEDQLVKKTSSRKIRDHRGSGSGSISGNSQYRSKNKLDVRLQILGMNGRGTEDQLVKKTSSRKIRDHR